MGFLRGQRFLLLLCLVVLVAWWWPLGEQVVEGFGLVLDGLIAGLFLLHGARLSREALWRGLGDARLQGVVLGVGYGLYPVLGVVVAWVAVQWWGVPAVLAAGLVYASVLPGTVQSAIALVGVARGHVAAAVCSAALSNVVGVLLVPLLVQWWVAPRLEVGMVYGGGESGGMLGMWWALVKLLLLPFVLGFVLGQWRGGALRSWLVARRGVLRWYDEGVVLLVVYGAFSTAMREGLWARLSGGELTLLLVLCGVLLLLALGVCALVARGLGMRRADGVVVLFGAGMKSLATGAPMAAVLFAPEVVAWVLLPVMVLHAMQLLVCGVMAGRLRVDDGDA